LGSKSAQKVARGSIKRQERNRSTRSQVKTDIAKAERLIAAGDLEAAQGAIKVAVGVLDKAAGKKVLHANNAARHKSRLLKKLNKAAAKPKSAPKSEKAD
jgi:small subunit ribosomal protein S20